MYSATPHWSQQPEGYRPEGRAKPEARREDQWRATTKQDVVPEQGSSRQPGQPYHRLWRLQDKAFGCGDHPQAHWHLYYQGWKRFWPWRGFCWGYCTWWVCLIRCSFGFQKLSYLLYVPPTSRASTCHQDLIHLWLIE